MFIGKKGKAGFIAGNAFIKSAMFGTPAFMSAGKGATVPSGILSDLADWEAIAGSPDNVLSKPAGRIRVSGDGGVLDGIKTVHGHHFDPNKWYKITVHMEIDVAGDGGDHDGGQFSIEMKGHDFDHVDATLGWGVAGGVSTIEPPIQTLVIQPHTAEAQAHFRVLSMGIAGDPIEIVSINVEEFDSDPAHPAATTPHGHKP